jgi:hypothetical protein
MAIPGAALFDAKPSLPGLLAPSACLSIYR